MRRLSLVTLVALLICSAFFGAQTASAAQGTAANAVKLKGKIVDQTNGAMGGVDVQLTLPGTPVRVVATGKTDAEGNFELSVAPGPYQLSAKVSDFKDINQTVRVTADMAPLNLTMALGLTTVVDVASVTNELGVDPDSSLNTDVITGDALLDLPDNEDDLLAYLTQLAQLRGGEGDVTLSVDGFNGANIPPLAQIAEIRIVNSSFSADGSTGPRIEIVTRAGSGKWTASTQLGFRDESLNASNHLATGKRPKSQNRDISVNSSGPVIPGRLSLNLSVSNSESDTAGSDLRAYTPAGYVSNGITGGNITRRITLSPRLMINKVHNLTTSFNYGTSESKNSGVGGFNLPERASNSKSNNWQLQISDRITKGKVVDTLRFSQNHSASNNTPSVLNPNSAVAYVLNPATGLPYTINVAGSFNGGAGQNSSHNVSDNFTVGNTMQWQAKPKLQFSAIAFELQYHKQDSNSRNNYNGTYTFGSLYDYCATLSFAGAQCVEELNKKQAAKAAFDDLQANKDAGLTLDITPKSPTQFTQVSGDSEIKVSQAELATWVQGEWRVTPRANVSFGLRYQIQQHFADYNNLAPVVGLSYQLRATGNWRTVVRAGIKKTDSTFSMGTYQQLRQSGTGSAQQTLTILTPTYPDPTLGGTSLAPTASTISTRKLADDASLPYQINPSFAWEQSMPRGMTASVSYNINRGFRQNRNMNINAPWPGTDLPDNLLKLLNSSDSTKYDAFGNVDLVNGLTLKQQGRAIVDMMRPFYPIVGNITETQSVGKSLTHTLSFQYRVSNYQFLNNRIRLTGNVTYSVTRGKDDSQFENQYNRLADYGTTSGTGSRVNATLNLQLPRRTTLGLNSIGWQSGRRYSWTTGLDTNGDSSNSDRPDNELRNGHIGPSSLSLPSATIGKTFILTTPAPASSPSLGRLVSSFAEPAQGGGGGGGGGNFGGGGGGQGGGAAANNANRIPTGARTMQFRVQISNIFNSSVRTNINGNLSSPLFQDVTGGSPGRKISLNLTMKLF